MKELTIYTIQIGRPIFVALFKLKSKIFCKHYAVS